ncbi:MAG: hypothetical protein Q7J98_12720 [Kiritimatiellia bacterium]|nr:hypothetical protein [Kiritimatiellia bacterium]
MNNRKWLMTTAAGLLLTLVNMSEARIKLVALPERDTTMIRLDNPLATLIEEERVLTLQKGLNKVDFSWKGVKIDVDSIRLEVLSHPATVTLLNVSYPPNEQALVWEISSADAYEEKVRISYLLSNIDRLITYKGVANKEETALDLKSYLILRNFSGEDFSKAKIMLDYGEAYEQGINHEETKQLLFLKQDKTPIKKMWKFDAAIQRWDPEKLDTNVGIPVSYQIENKPESGLGKFALWGGKARVFQDDGHDSTIFLGEDEVGLVPVGEKMEIYIGDSRDIVVTQRKMKDEKINIRRNNAGAVVLYDTAEIITAKIENFKDKPAVITVIQHIPGQWEMEDCNLKYERKDAGTLEFTVELAPKGKQELTMNYHRKNVREELGVK